MKFLKLTTGCFGLLAGLGLWLNAGALRAATPVGIGQNFTASTFGVDSPYVPADSNGAIGPNHFVEFINGRYSVYNKLTGARVQTFTDTGFWSAAGVTLNAGWDVSDPRVIFDPTVGRWFAAQIDLDPSGVVNANHFLIAVSAGTNPAGLWRGVSFTADPTTGNFADFPTFGLDANGVYLAADMFNAAGSDVGTKIVSIPKADLLGVPPSVAKRGSPVRISLT